MIARFLPVLTAALALAAGAARAEVRVVDDAGEPVVLAAPAKRIVSLAPHVTEMLFEVGAGALVVGTMEHSDHPEAAKRIPHVGDHAALDIERIAALKPDLIVAWLQGNPAKQVEALRAFRIPIFMSQPRKLGDIPSDLERLGQLAGMDAEGRKAGQAYATRLADLERRFSQRPTVRVFYQIWDKPLMTVNGGQIISDVLRLCGGENVFADAGPLVPQVDVEAVMSAHPEAVVRTGTDAGGGAGLEIWRSLRAFPPTQNGNLIFLRTDSLGRHSPRILDGATLLCDALEGVRSRRK